MEFVLNHPDTGPATLLLIFDGVPYEADSSHPWWEEIIDLCLEDDARVVDLFPIRPFQRPSRIETFPTPAQNENIEDVIEHFEDVPVGITLSPEAAAMFGITDDARGFSIAEQIAESDPPFTTREGGTLRPRNDILVAHFKERGYTVKAMAEAEGYSEDEAWAWVNSSPELRRELSDAAAKPSWANVVITDDDGETD